MIFCGVTPPHPDSTELIEVRPLSHKGRGEKYEEYFFYASLDSSTSASYEPAAGGSPGAKT